MQSHNTDFSVIIPVYNRAEYIGRAIESVLNQTYCNYKIYIIDDGSTDNTKEIVDKYLKQYPEKINYLYQKNKGVSSARNTGIRNSGGEWLAFLDSDDEWLKDKLEKQVDFIIKNPEIPIVHGEEIWIRNGVRVNQKNKHKKSGGRIFLNSLPLCLISPSAVLLRRSELLSCGMFNEEYLVCEDYDLWLKMTSLYEVGFIETPIIKKYGGHDDQLSHKFKAMDYWRIKSLDFILKIRELSALETYAVKQEIVTKSKILLNGYLKHNNLENYDEVLKIYNRYITELEQE